MNHRECLRTSTNVWRSLCDHCELMANCIRKPIRHTFAICETSIPFETPQQRPRMLKPGVHTNDFAPIHRLRALKLGHASLATVFRPGRLTLQPILRENLESPVLMYQPITTAVVSDACLNTRWHHGAYTSAVLRESLGLDRVVTVYVA